MKLERKHKVRIILGIGLIFILYGLFDAFFKFNVSKKVVDDVSFVLMLIAFALLFSNRKKKTEDSTTTTEAAPDVQEESENAKELSPGETEISDNKNVDNHEIESNDQPDSEPESAGQDNNIELNENETESNEQKNNSDSIK